MCDKQITEIAKLQLQQSIETYRVQMSLLVQICTVLVIADATTVGYAVQQQLAGIIWVGAIFPVTMYLMIRSVFRLTLPILATAISIEQEYRDSTVFGLMSTFSFLAVSPTFVEEVKSAIEITPEADRLKTLAGVRRPSFRKVSHTKILLLAIITGQLAAPFLLHCYAHWSFLTHKEQPQNIHLIW